MEVKLMPQEVLEYLRKSRQDDPNKTVQEVIAQHKRIADEWVFKNLKSQIPDCNIYMERVSGETIRDRIEFQKVLQRVESPEIKAVFVIEPQRLSRGDLEDAGHIINVFRYSNTLIITPNHVYDLNKDSDRMLMEMELKQGNQYLEYVKAIMKRGKDDAAKRGIWIPTYPPYGYDITHVDKFRTLKINPTQTEAVQIIFQMYSDGIGCHLISKYLYEHGYKPAKTDKFSASAIKAILRNPVYIGRIRWNSTIRKKVISEGQIQIVRAKQEAELYDGLHEPIITMELWDKVQNIIGSRPHTKRGLNLINPLSGMIFCGKCGKALHVEGHKDLHTRYCCPQRIYCGNGSVITDYIYADITDAIEKEIDDRKILIETDNSSIIKNWEDECKNLKSRISKLDKKELMLWKDRYESEQPMPDHVFRSLTQSLMEDRETLRQLLEKLESEVPENKQDHEKKLASLYGALSDFNNEDLSVEERNKVLKTVIERIEVTRDVTRGNTHYSYEKHPYSISIKFKI